MKYWPVPDSYSKNIPKSGSNGSFWRNRGDRYHCGIDIYAPPGSEVLSIEDGKVVDLGIFTSPDRKSYWNNTYYVVIENKSGTFSKYAELSDVKVKIGETIRAGQLLGRVGTVLNIAAINKTSPVYIQRLKKNRRHSMLHFELYTSLPKQGKEYLGGNWFRDKEPENLLDPTEYLRSVLNMSF
jgi:murein DD-endopeptidase MepM/ murein hydrolase activator NlpD